MVFPSLTAICSPGIRRDAGFSHRREFNRHLHVIDLQGAVAGGQGHVGGIAAVADGDAVASGNSLGAVEGEPAAADIGLKPGVKILRLQLIEVTHHHAGGDVEAARQGDAQVRVVAADAFFGVCCIDGGGAGVAGAGDVPHVVAQPLLDGGHLAVAGGRGAHDGAGEIVHHVALAVAAGQQELEGALRKLLHGDKLGVPVHVGEVRGMGTAGAIDVKGPCGDDQALAEVAKRVAVLGDGHVGRERVLLPCDPLRRAASGAEHHDCGHGSGSGVGDVAGGVEDHGSLGFSATVPVPAVLKRRRPADREPDINRLQTKE